MNYDGSYFQWNGLFHVQIFLAIIAGLLLDGSQAALADDFNIIPSIGIREEYDDNILFSEDKLRDYRTVIIPGITVQEKSERLDANMMANAKAIRYADKKQFDTVDFAFTGDLNYQYTQRNNISLNARYSRDSTASREINPIAFVMNTFRSYQQKYSIQGGHAFNEKTSALLSYSYTKYDYLTVPVQSIPLNSNQSGPEVPEPPVITPPPPPTPPTPPTPPGTDPEVHPPADTILADSDVVIHAPSLRLLHKFNELTQGSFDTGYSHYTYKYSRVENYVATLGLNRVLNDLWSISLSGGGRFTVSEYKSVRRTYLVYPDVYTDASLPAVTDRNWGWVGQCAINYNGLYSAGTLSFTKDITAGQSTARERTAVMLEARHRFSEELSGNIASVYSLFNSKRGEFAGEASADTVINLSAGLRYEFNRDVSLDGGYSRLMARLDKADVERNFAFINLTFRFPMF